MWLLFLDDIRNPEYVTSCKETIEQMSIARSSEEAIRLIEEKGMPLHIYFDHDLGGDDTAMRLVNWMIEKDLDEDILNPELSFSVHSSNPVGAANIEGTLIHRLRFKAKNL